MCKYRKNNHKEQIIVVFMLFLTNIPHYKGGKELSLHLFLENTTFKYKQIWIS